MPLCGFFCSLSFMGVKYSEEVTSESSCRLQTVKVDMAAESNVLPAAL